MRAQALGYWIFLVGYWIFKEVARVEERKIVLTAMVLS